MLNRNLSIIIGGLVIAVCVVFSGCIFNQAPPQDAFDAANDTAETVFQAFNTGSYDQFSANLSPLLKRGFNESRFVDTRSQIQSKYGNYTSKPAPQGSVSQGYNNFYYDAHFEKGTLKIRLVMNTTNPSLVEGIWFPNGI